MEEENGHFEADFDTTTSGTKHINSCNKPTDFFYLLYLKLLWNLIVTNTNKYARDQNLSHWKDVNVKTMNRSVVIIFNMGLIKKWLLVSQKLYEHSLVLISDGPWPIQKNSLCISYSGKIRNPIRQYLPNKHHARFGTKVWLLADSEHAYV